MQDERIALITGSYDPITVGHMHLIRVASAMFDRVYVTVCANTEKAVGAFRPEDRMTLVEDAVRLAGLDNVTVVLCTGLVSDAAREYGAKYLATAGKSYEEILKHYYRDTDITYLYH